MFVVCCALFGVCCLLSVGVVRCVLSVVCGMVFVVCWLLLFVCCLLSAADW